LAVVVSKENNCKYCMNHHGEALSYLWKDKEKVKEFIHRPETVTFSEKQKTMVNYASRLTKSPSLVTEEDIIQMRSAGFSDKEILDINLIICYFNFVNRIALGLVVSFSAEEMKGYNY
ncbi:MAG: peroxidase-related enzyme, partial [Thermoplasmatota archaeon]